MNLAAEDLLLSAGFVTNSVSHPMDPAKNGRQFGWMTPVPM
jgi:hypothetical protein